MTWNFTIQKPLDTGTYWRGGGGIPSRIGWPACFPPLRHTVSIPVAVVLEGRVASSGLSSSLTPLGRAACALNVVMLWCDRYKCVLWTIAGYDRGAGRPVPWRRRGAEVPPASPATRSHQHARGPSLLGGRRRRPSTKRMSSTASPYSRSRITRT